MNDHRIYNERKIENIKPMHDQSLSSIMHATCEKAQVALKLLHQIDRHVFGCENMLNNAENGSPNCFMEELVMTDFALDTLCVELENIMKRLGV